MRVGLDTPVTSGRRFDGRVARSAARVCLFQRENMKKTAIVFCVFVFCVCVLSGALPLQLRAQKRQVVPEDLFSLRDVSDIRLSPSTADIAFVLTSIDTPPNPKFPTISIIPSPART